MYSALENTIKQLATTQISNERKQLLQPLSRYIQEKKDNRENIRLNFICTHNSRRSQFAQIWAQALAHYNNISKVFCYSGGTQVTALFPKVAETLVQQGFIVAQLSNNQNIVYAFKFDTNELASIGFSKLYNNVFNPATNFAAVMTCSNADEGCPVVLGADARFAIPYNDPKAFDGTTQMNQQYCNYSNQIATEMNYVFSEIN